MSDEINITYCPVFQSVYRSTSKLSDEQFGKMVRAMCAYMFDGDESETDDDIVNMLVAMAKPNLDTTRANIIRGSKGGRPRKDEEKTQVKSQVKTQVISQDKTQVISQDKTQVKTEKEKEREKEKAKDRAMEIEKENIYNASDSVPKSSAGAGGSSDVAKINTIISEFTSDDELKLALHEFVKMRTKIKKPITPYGLQQALKKLRELGNDQTSNMVKVINQSIEKSWQSFYPIDNRQSKAQNEPPKQRTMQERFNAVTELARQKGIIT